MSQHVLKDPHSQAERRNEGEHARGEHVERRTWPWRPDILDARCRGNPPIIPWESDLETLFFSGNPNDRPLPEGASYPDPLGPNGIPAISTSLGSVDSDGSRG